MPRPSKSKPLRLAKSPAEIFTLKVTLMDSDPPIWRTFEVASTDTLTDLHETLQHVMGWTNSHLHSFETSDGKRYQAGELLQFDDFGQDILNADDVILEAMKDQLALQVAYAYDFGDGWMHTVELLRVRAAKDEESLPRCTGGELSCPPEDCGGMYGFYDLVKALNDPKHPEYDHYQEWHGGFDPDTFDLEEVNELFDKTI